MDTHTNDERLWDTLARWEELYQEGRDVPPEELCRDCPELFDQLNEHIAILKRTAWMTQLTTAAPDPQAQDASDLTPKTLGEYTILEPLGAGGQGKVFTATHRRMARTVVIKLLPHSTHEATARFQAEVKATAKLAHPNIVTAFDAGECDGISFLVMEFNEGVDLHRHVQQHGPLPVEQAVNCTLQAAKGLAFAHEKGVIHRDVKPANLLLCGDGTVKILDMGLAQSRGSQPEAAVGTPDFMAPELVVDPSKAGPRSDIYSLGCTLWFLLTGKPIFEGSTVIQKLLAHREHQVPSLRTIRPDVPDTLDTLFRRMVAKSPEQRYGSAAEVAKALSNLNRLRQWRAVWLWAAVILFAVVVVAWPSPPKKLVPESPPSEPMKLRAVNLDFTPTTDDDLKQFGGWNDLGELRLTKTKITDAGLDHLRDGTRLQVLDLNHTAITDVGLGKIASLTELRRLGLSGTKISDHGLRHLKGMKELHHLNLDYTGIGDAGLAHLADIASLEDLRLTKTKITDNGLVSLKGLTKLKKIDLHHTAITDSGLKQLAGLPLKEIGVAGTKITPAGLNVVQGK